MTNENGASAPQQKYSIGEHPGLRRTGTVFGLAGIYMVLTTLSNPFFPGGSPLNLESLFVTQSLVIGPLAFIAVNIAGVMYLVNFSSWWKVRSEWKRPTSSIEYARFLTALGTAVMFATQVAVVTVAMLRSDIPFPFSLLFQYAVPPFPLVYSIGTIIHVVSRIWLNYLPSKAATDS